MIQLPKIEQLQNIVGYKFKNLDLVTVALSHPGHKRYNKDLIKNFERLEFLGDRVLGLTLANFLYEKFLTETEGDLATRISTLGGTNFLIDIAKKTRIIDCFSIPKSFFVSDTKNSSTIADILEALFGAIFLDSDFETTKKIIVNFLGTDLTRATHKKKDSKTHLQELTQAKTMELPVYKVIETSGKQHNPIFKVEVAVFGHSSIGVGGSKKAAELDAANKMIKRLKKTHRSLH
ncbi:MAG: ribonuclease III [Holosporaceae bacterium]|jgi:ribonuclease-3|nr:ribonuclease III [Holosporaceae bacterium]